MKFGKTIKMFLIDGEPDGRMSCELSNWTGKALKLPRRKVKDSIDRKELYNTGIYILFGKSSDSGKKDRAYIGEGEAIYNRLLSHVALKDFWNEVVVIVSKDENLNKAHIKYLESRLYEIAKQVNRYELENGNNPPRPTLSEADVAEMEEFLENIKLLVYTLGYKIFEELRKTQTVEEQINNTYYINAARGAKGKGQMTNEGFLVLKDSVIASTVTASSPKGWVNLRKELIEEGIITLRNDVLVFNEDYLFTSPSAAAAVIMGRNANGLTEWRLIGGEALKEVESRI